MAAPAVVDEGGYGQIIKPALPNRNEEGRLIPFPGHITKLFLRKSNYNSLRNRENVIRSIAGPTAAMNAYAYPYRGQNLSPELQASLGIHRPEKRLYMLHQPDMGYSVGWLCTSMGMEEHGETIIGCSSSTLFSSIQHLLRQTASMAEHGYVHGDIRPRNLLFNPATGRFSLIDFDMFDTYDTFYREFMTGHGDYFSAPEALLVPEFEAGLIDAYDTDDVAVDPLQFEQHASNTYDDYKHYWNQVGIQSIDDYVQRADAAIRANTESLRRAMREGRPFETEVVRGLDNHALALTLLEFFACYPSLVTDSMGDLMSLLREMADLEMDRRPSAQDASDAAEVMNVAQGGRRSRRTRRTQRTRRTRRTRRTPRTSFRRKH